MNRTTKSTSTIRPTKSIREWAILWVAGTAAERRVIAGALTRADGFTSRVEALWGLLDDPQLRPNEAEDLMLRSTAEDPGFDHWIELVHERRCLRKKSPAVAHFEDSIDRLRSTARATFVELRAAGVTLDRLIEALRNLQDSRSPAKGPITRAEVLHAVEAAIDAQIKEGSAVA